MRSSRLIILALLGCTWSLMALPAQAAWPIPPQASRTGSITSLALPSSLPAREANAVLVSEGTTLAKPGTGSNRETSAKAQGQATPAGASQQHQQSVTLLVSPPGTESVVPKDERAKETDPQATTKPGSGGGTGGSKGGKPTPNRMPGGLQ